jgi:glutathione S-transferase
MTGPASDLTGEHDPMKLYDLELSGNCYKVRLFLSILGIPWEKIPVNSKARENKRPEFLALNPRGQIPVLDDDGFVVWDSSSILVYLARKHGGEPWYPAAARDAAEVARWVAISQQAEITATGLSRARAISLFGTAGDLAGFQERGRHFLKFLDGYMQSRTWLALERPTIGDIACYPYIAMAPQGGVSLDEFTALNAWFARIRSLAGYVELPQPTPENLAVASGPTGPGLSKK